MKKTLFISMLMVVAAAFSSCKKDDDTPSGSGKSNSEKLVGKNWKMTAATINPPLDTSGSGHTITDLYAVMAECNRDDLHLFNANGTAVMDEGATKCDPGSPQTTAGVWSFNADQTVLTYNGDDMNVKSIGETELIMYSSEEFDGTMYTVTYVHTKQ